MRTYGGYAGRRKIPENESNCVWEVTKYSMNWPMFLQCKRKRGHGPNGLYCKQHGKMAEDPNLPKFLVKES